SLCAWSDAVSTGARNDRSRSRHCDRDGLQSRIVADTEYADDLIARVHTNENVAGGSYLRVNDQPGVFVRPGRPDRLARIRQDGEFVKLLLRGLSGAGVLVWSRANARGLRQRE